MTKQNEDKVDDEKAKKQTADDHKMECNKIQEDHKRTMRAVINNFKNPEHIVFNDNGS